MKDNKNSPSSRPKAFHNIFRMKNLPLHILLLLLSLTLSSCIALLLPPISFNNYYRITHSNFHLIEKSERDTVCYTSYDIQYNLEGDTCVLMNLADSIAQGSGFGIGINYQTQWIAKDKGSPYGPYPNLGNIDSVAQIKIELLIQNQAIDITNHLKGDSTLAKYLYKYNGIGNSHRIKGKCCYEAFYIENIVALKNKMNGKPDELDNINLFDYFFWLDKEYHSTLDSIDEIKFTTVLVDSLNKARTVENVWKIK